MKLSNLITEPQRNTLTNSPNSHNSYIIHPFTAPRQQLHPLKDLLYWINTLTIRFTEFHYITGVLDSTSLFVELVRQKVRNKGCPLHLLLHRLRFPGRSGQWPDQSVWRGAKEDLSKDGGCNACLRTFLCYIFFLLNFLVQQMWPKFSMNSLWIYNRFIKERLHIVSYIFIQNRKLSYSYMYLQNVPQICRNIYSFN